MNNAPWSDIGRVESDIRSIQSTLNQKAESHELYQIRSNVEALERSVGEIRSECDNLRYEIETMKNEIIELKTED